VIPDVFDLLNVAGVRLYLGEPRPRVFRHGRAPQNVAALYATWSSPSIAPENGLDDPPPVDRVEIQLDIWSANEGDDWRPLERAAEACRDAIEAAGHCVTSIIDGGQDAATNRYRLTLQFTVWESR
jgi:hypothetical protein